MNFDQKRNSFKIQFIFIIQRQTTYSNTLQFPLSTNPNPKVPNPFLPLIPPFTEGPTTSFTPPLSRVLSAAAKDLHCTSVPLFITLEIQGARSFASRNDSSESHSRTRRYHALTFSQLRNWKPHNVLTLEQDILSMATCVASPFSSKLHLRKAAVRERAYSNQTTSFKTVQRNCSRNQCQLVRFSAWKMFEPSASGTTHCKIGSRLQVTSIKCIGLGALVDLDGVADANLVPAVDQVLLMASIFLTYTAGIVSFGEPSIGYEKINSDKKVLFESSDNYGSVVKEDYKLESKYTFNAVRGKLLNSLNALEQKAYSGDIILHSAKQILSLNAIAGPPKLRLLWVAFQAVEEQVKNISSTRSVSMDDNFFSEFLQRSCHSICNTWLQDEYSLLKGNFDKELVSMILEKVKQDNSIVQSITRSGKKDLYLELLQYLSFGSLREDCCYDSCIFGLHGISILEDLVIAIADGVASVYLEFISVDSDVSSKNNRLDMSFCALSTRELQKLRNEVALNQWLYHNMDTVVSMYEDRFDLCTFGSQRIDLPNTSQTETRSWWRRLTQLNTKPVSPELQCMVINHFSMPVKRTKELRALAGWRYYFSLFLELSDISMPLIRAVVDKVSSAISFFLVTLIGRSLGLIYTGIRQSLKWK